MSDDSAAIKYLHETLALQKAAFLNDQSPSVETRISYLHKIAGMLMANRQETRDALNSDFGSHPDGTADVVETLGPAGRAMFVAEQLKAWMEDEPRYVDPALYGNATAVVRREPKGVIGTLAPFNFPFDLTVGPLVEQLAAGNRVIIKPSEFTPACAKHLKTMINATFPRDLVEVVIGGVELGIEFTKLKWDHLLYTGSPMVGKLVMAEAAKNLVPVTLELGGKCPAIIAAGSVTQKTVETIVGVKLLKNGQMCITIDTVHVPRAEVDKFVELAKAYITSLQGYSKSADCTGIITERHLARLTKMLADAKAAGANVVDLEEDGVVDMATRRMPLSLIIDPSADLAVSKEEIFGPILPVLSYDKIEDAVAHINADERPLALYIFSEDDKEIDWVVKNTKSGGTTVNACALQGAMPSLGFGGIGNSGMGRHHGLEGFREFTNPKGLVKRGDQPDLIAAFAPPYAFAVGIADHAYAQAAAAAAAASA